MLHNDKLWLCIGEEVIVDLLNSMEEERAIQAFHRCCGSIRWATVMTDMRPFSSDQILFEKATETWLSMDKEDFLEAFLHHPQIGANKESLRAKFQKTHQWSANEQSGVTGASEDVLERLVIGNKAYLEKFGYIFIVCATGKSAKEMCEILHIYS